MSAGYVSGAAALYLETHPNATPDQVGEELKRSGDDQHAARYEDGFLANALRRRASVWRRWRHEQ